MKKKFRKKLNSEIKNLPKFTKFQFRTYFLCSQISSGYFSTYKCLAKILKSNPRAVGRVLKFNPFDSEAVPCHRVIASNYFIGGYRGMWGKGKNVINKKKLLTKEGLIFNKKGYLLKELRKKRFYLKFI